MLRAVSVCLIVCLAGGSVRADRREEAHAAEARADGAFEHQQYDKALVEYQASYAKSPKPYILFHIGECYRMLGKAADAITTYRKFIGKVTKGADRKKAVQYIADLDIGPKPAPEPAPAPEVPAPQSQDVEAPPVSSEDIAKKKQDEDERRKLGVADDAILAKPAAEPAPPGADPNAHVEEIVHSEAPPAHFYPAGYQKPTYRRWWPWTTLGIVVAAGVGIGVGVALTRPKFDSELPIGGPGVHTPTSSMLVRF